MTKNEAVRIAVEWWANKISDSEPHSNGDNSSASIFACLFADMGRVEPAKEQILTFKLELTRRLERQIERVIESLSFISKACAFLSCDYHPCEMLRDAAYEAGISTSNFPFKTYMIIESLDGQTFTVNVSDGYGQPYEEVRIKE